MEEESLPAGDAGDRLSALPDCLLHEIMSRMKARQVVQTCVLSARWRHLWRSVPCLDLDHEEFVQPTAAGAGVALNSYAAKERADWERFEDFADHLLVVRPHVAIAHLDAFRLHGSRALPRRAEQAARWIRHGIKYYSAAAAGGVPRELIPSSAGSSSCWRVRRLHLSNVRLDDRFAAHIESGCRLLEDLELRGCRCKFREIASRSLRSLALWDCNCAGGLAAISLPAAGSLVIHGVGVGDGRGYRGILAITAPAVAQLRVALSRSGFTGGVPFKEMPRLAEARIHLHRVRRQSQLALDQPELISSVANATDLELLGFNFKMKMPMTLPEFRNLRALSLNTCDLGDDLQILAGFLRNSLNLEKLTLQHCKFPAGKTSEKISSSFCQNLAGAKCEKLKLTKIIVKDEDAGPVIELLSSILGTLPNNKLELTRVD